MNLREYATAHAHDDRLPRVALDSHEKRRRAAVEAAADVAKQFDKLILLRPDERFYAADGSLKYADGSRFLYADDDHLTDQGAEYVRAIFEAVLPAPSAGAQE